MKNIELGRNANGRPIMLSPEVRRHTHTHVIGGSGTGKSKFLEWMIRQDIRAGHGLCLIDWHGTLYNDVLSWCSHLDVGRNNDYRKVILLNPANPTHITGFNPFMNKRGPGSDVSAMVSRRVDATIRPWGITNTDTMPSFENLCRLLYTFAAENNETLVNAANLLPWRSGDLRRYAAEHVSDPYMRGAWEELEQIKTFRDWRDMSLSTNNRFARFLGSRVIKLFMGQPDNNIDLLEIMDQGHILLVNLGSSDELDRVAARVFASLFLNEFMETAMRRAGRDRATKPPHYMLYLDEFQEYMTEDVGAMLDQVRKGGLHMILAHQHLGHLADNERLRESVFVNARIRAVFGGLTFPTAVELANEMFLPDLNTRQIKKAYYHTTHLYREETRTSYTHGSTTSSSSSGGSSRSRSNSSGESHSKSTPGGGSRADEEGWFTESDGDNRSSGDSEGESSSWGESSSESYSESVVPVWVPIPVQELSSEVEWTLDEKRAKVAELLKIQSQRHCYIKLDTETTQPLQIPFVKSYGGDEESLVEYEKEIYRAQGALDAVRVDAAIEGNTVRFLKAAEVYNNREDEDISETVGRS